MSIEAGQPHTQVALLDARAAPRPPSSVRAVRAALLAIVTLVPECLPVAVQLLDRKHGRFDCIERVRHPRREKRR